MNWDYVERDKPAFRCLCLQVKVCQLVILDWIILNDCLSLGLIVAPPKSRPRNNDSVCRIVSV